MVEILVSLLLFFMMLLGFDGAQITALRAVETNYYFFAANQQIHALSELIYARNGHLNAFEETEWNKQNKLLLPKGNGQVGNHFPYFVITVMWGTKQSNICQKNITHSQGCMQTTIQI